MGRLPRHYDFLSRRRWSGREDGVGNRSAGFDEGRVWSGLERGLAAVRVQLSLWKTYSLTLELSSLRLRGKRCAHLGMVMED